MAGIQDISNITYLLHPPNPPWPPFFRELKICVLFYESESYSIEYYSGANIIKYLMSPIFPIICSYKAIPECPDIL